MVMSLILLAPSWGGMINGMTPQQLTEEYIFAHDLREASAKIYRAAKGVSLR